MIKLQEFIIEHPNDWRTLLEQEPYNIKITEDGDYIIFKYNQLTSDFNIELVRECRGIILRKSDWSCVCHAFDKFGNYGESYCPDIDWETASVQEKIDGSLIKVWYDNDQWHISTNGTIDAYKSNVNDYMNFGELFEQAIAATHKFASVNDFFDLLTPTYTYMFELVSPYNRVVIPYTETKLYFLGWRENNHNWEFAPNLYTHINDYFDIPKRYKLHSLDDVVNAAAALAWDEEGYVVCDAEFNRVKIKSPAYVMAHYARNNNVMTTERIIEVILKGEEAEFLIYAEDYADRLNYVKAKMNEFAHQAVETMKWMWDATARYESRGAYAQQVMQQPVHMRDFLFHCYDDRIFWDYAKDWTARDWAKIIKEND